MRGNVEKVLERDQKLSQLDDRADALQQGARFVQMCNQYKFILNILVNLKRKQPSWSENIGGEIAKCG